MIRFCFRVSFLLPTVLSAHNAETQLFQFRNIFWIMYLIMSLPLFLLCSLSGSPVTALVQILHWPWSLLFSPHVFCLSSLHFLEIALTASSDSPQSSSFLFNSKSFCLIFECSLKICRSFSINMVFSLLFEENIITTSGSPCDTYFCLPSWLW